MTSVRLLTIVYKILLSSWESEYAADVKERTVECLFSRVFRRIGDVHVNWSFRSVDYSLGLLPVTALDYSLLADANPCSVSL